MGTIYTLPQIISNRYNNIKDYAESLPIIMFYKYLWKTNPKLMYFTLFTNYLLPLLLEVMPWYLSRRLLSTRLRDMKNTMSHNLMNNIIVSKTTLLEYIICTILYVLINTFDDNLKTSVEYSQKLLIKRLVVERIVYSELGALEMKFQQIFGSSSVRADQLEISVFKDINDTLHMFNFTLPNLIRGLWTTALQSYDLYSLRSLIDPLLLLRPFILTVFNESVQTVVDRAVESNRDAELDRVSFDSSSLVANVVDGLAEIQINNMQKEQLKAIDKLSDREIKAYSSYKTIENVWKMVNNRSMLDFVSEIYFVQLMMKSSGINHEQYRKLQSDIEYIFKLIRRNISYSRQIYRVLDSQSKVSDLISLPSFMNEVANKHVNEFKSLEVKSLKFNYPAEINTPLVLDICEDNNLKFLPGKCYGIIGQNRSGKSTLVQILAKLYICSNAEIYFNGINYRDLSRENIRNLISYVPQRPFIFPGTILDNIRMAAPSAIDLEVELAAELAGCFIFERPTLLPSLEVEKSSIIRLKPWEVSKNWWLEYWPFIYLKSYSYFAPSRKRKSFALLPPLPKSNNATPAVGDIQEKISSVGPEKRYTDLLGVPKISENVRPKLKRRKSTYCLFNIDNINTPPIVTDDFANSYESLIERIRKLEMHESNTIHPVLTMKTTARGANLSGGFAQSVALARIFLRPECKIVILDESLGQMDAVKKREFILPRLFDFVRKHNMTLLFITHEMSMMQNMDQIIVLEDGKLAGQGTHSELVDNDCMAYRRLLGN